MHYNSSLTILSAFLLLIGFVYSAPSPLPSDIFIDLPTENNESPSTSTERLEEPPQIVEAEPSPIEYEYTKTDNGYTYTHSYNGFFYRDETLEVKNKGTPEEETVIEGFYSFKGEDGYKYFIRYTIDKSGSNIVIDRTAIHRIPPGALKSLVG